jgi:hypothetical protein
MNSELASPSEIRSQTFSLPVDHSMKGGPVSAPPWFPSDALSSAIDHISQLPLTPEEKDAQLSRLKEQISSLKSIKSVSLKLDSAEIVPSRGLMPTTFGVDVGPESDGNVSTGWSNFFQRGDFIVFEGKFKHLTAPTLSVSFTQPLLKNANFSLDNPFGTFRVSATLDIQPISGENIQTGLLESILSPQGPFGTHRVAFSVVNYRLSARPPVVLSSDRSPYFKASIRSDLPLFGHLIDTALEVAAVVSKSCAANPFVKLSVTSHYNMGYGLGFYVAGGAIAASKPVPYPEKFRPGGIPVSHGIEHERFGPIVGGFPSGCDSYASGTLDFSTLVFPEYNLNAHFFLNGAVAANRRSNSILDFAPSVSAVVSVGAGLTFTQGPVRVQANVQHPYYVSSGLSFARFQLGISPV